MPVPLRRVVYTEVATGAGRPPPEGDGWPLITAPTGPDTGVTNPEQLFAAGYAASLAAALADGCGHDLSGADVTAAVTLGKTGHGYGFAVALTVHVPGLDPAVLREVAEVALRRCGVWVATHQNIPTTLHTA
jgi:organic hydroperoxide reductase OsmC/OhrA